ncbi:MAG: hypothetical protein SH809_17880 [Rhodothermales bacterium]|nr:hypothetical protein [Rhodothermales bacterium]
MDDERNHGPIIQFSDLNLLGKAVFLGGFFTRVATQFVDTAIQATADVVIEAQKAFKQGLDPNIEDARIIEETSVHQEKRTERPDDR